MPHRAEETSKVDHVEPHWVKAALVVIDLQRDFLDGGASPISGTSEVVPGVARLTAAFRQAGRPIAHVIRFYKPGESDVDLPRRAIIEAGARIVAPGSMGADIPEDVLPGPVKLDAAQLLSGQAQTIGPREKVFYKPRWSAFYRTSLEAWLVAEGCDTIVVAGCNLPNCPRATLFDASERDFRTVLAFDAVSQVTPERLADLDAIGVRLVDVADITSALRTNPAVKE
ncbi:cysteine hydrolase [Leucobacter allii]|uniref:cysteine hydrolase family protein n=1 Tax=Leucobacter allii TaxID=2932247 RepID=UPI001FD22846|nr:isochorismatase family cysteine hydrolase [Leucobacter allii]UOR02462.1 cysteine hydrolase [Leucobacter allii]